MPNSHDYRITTHTTSMGVEMCAAYFAVSRVDAEGIEVLLTTEFENGLAPVGTFNDEHRAHAAAHTAASKWLVLYIQSLEG